jgi:hypothetical protein
MYWKRGASVDNNGVTVNAIAGGSHQVDEQQRRPRRTGVIDGEAMPFVSSDVDPVTGRVRVTVVQRGGRALERLQALAGRDRVMLQLPGVTQPLEVTPLAIDIAAAGSGAQPLSRVDLTFAITGAETSDREETPAGRERDLAERLARIENKLDRLLALLARDTPGA